MLPTRSAVIPILVLCQALYWAGGAIAVAFSGLAGYQLAENKLLATLPFACLQIGTAAAAFPAARLMERFGRRLGFMLGAIGGIAGGAISGWAILQGSFPVFCLGNACIGIFQAFAQHYRYAAGEVGAADARSKAVSLVIAGGLLGVLLGPEVARLGRDILEPASFAGSYFGLAALALASLVLSMLLEPLRVSAGRHEGTVRLWPVLCHPAAMAGITNTVMAYAVMVLIMTATPLAVVGHGHSVEAAADIVRWHMFGMFAPALFAGHLAARFGSAWLILAGQGLMLASIGVALTGTSLPHFWTTLVLVGIGWNFMFIGSTAVLSEIAGAGERLRAQAANECLLFLAVASSALLSGFVLEQASWEILNLLSVPFLIVAALATVRFASRRRDAQLSA